MRPDSYREKTILWIKKYIPEVFGEIHFTNGYVPGRIAKSKICLAHNYNVIIEDAPENAIECAEKGIGVLLMNQPWNNSGKNSLLDSHQYISRVKNWSEILEKLK